MTIPYTPAQRLAAALRLSHRSIEQVAGYDSQHMVTWAHGYATATLTNAYLLGDIEPDLYHAFERELEQTREATLQYLAEQHGCTVSELPRH